MDDGKAYDMSWVFPKLKKTNNRMWRVFSSMTIASVGFLSKMFIGERVLVRLHNSMGTKLFIPLLSVWLNKTKVHNRDVLLQALKTRPEGTPLITISNHESCCDDPGLWGSRSTHSHCIAVLIAFNNVQFPSHSAGVLPLKYVCSTRRIRWALAAHDICFTNKR